MVTYTVAVDFVNTTGSNATLCGWVDFDQDGIFQSDEGRCATVTSGVGTRSQDLDFIVPLADRNRSGTLVARFRITSGSLTTSTPSGRFNDGEAEDHTVNATTLPVSVAWFSARKQGTGVLAEWETVSETRNLGFHLYRQTRSGLQSLSEMIPAATGAAMKVKRYQQRLPLLADQSVLVLKAVDTQGHEVVHASTRVNAATGRKQQSITTIDWAKVRAETPTQKGLNDKPPVQKAGLVSATMAEFATNEFGLHVVRDADLIAAGLDLAGVPPDQIAVTLNGQPVARDIHTPAYDLIFRHAFDEGTAQHGPATPEFGPDSSIVIWATAPDFPDALYRDAQIYRIGVQPQSVRNAATLEPELSPGNNWHLRRHIFADNNLYRFTSSAQDPWSMAELKDIGSPQNAQYSVQIAFPGDGLNQHPGKVSAAVIGVTDFPQAPDHAVELLLNDQALDHQLFDGTAQIVLQAEVPAHLWQADNALTVRVTGASGAPADLVMLENIIVDIPVQSDPQVAALLHPDQFGNSSTFLLADAPSDIWGYQMHESGTLTRLLAQDAALSVVQQPNTFTWVSRPDDVLRTTPLGLYTPETIGHPRTDLLIIGAQSLLPAVGQSSHPLWDYKDFRASLGQTIAWVSVEDIYRHWGGGMMNPEAIRQYLAAGYDAHSDTAILLLGDDSYDYQDNLGLGSFSFIPTLYRSTQYIPFTPADGTLVDFNGDDIADMAIGRWPVRTMAELSAIVDKTIQWHLQSPVSLSVAVADQEDGDTQAFANQSERILDQLHQVGWQDDQIHRVYANDFIGSGNQSAFDQARATLFSHWEQQSTITSFVGHGSPSQWSRFGLLSASDLPELLNANTPTWISSLTCYTSYFVSPYSDALGHALITGSQGAVIVHGASTLSSYDSNESFGLAVREQLLSGSSIGQAILSAKQMAAQNGWRDQAINWNLLGDPLLHY